jgi:hypothetical protein
MDASIHWIERRPVVRRLLWGGALLLLLAPLVLGYLPRQIPGGEWHHLLESCWLEQANGRWLEHRPAAPTTTAPGAHHA